MDFIINIRKGHKCPNSIHLASPKQLQNEENKLSDGKNIIFHQYMQEFNRGRKVESTRLLSLLRAPLKPSTALSLAIPFIF